MEQRWNSAVLFAWFNLNTLLIERYLLTAFAMHIFKGKKKCYVRKTLLTLHLKVNFFGGINTSSETSEDMQVIV